MGYSDELWARHEPIWRAVHDHPFVRGIGDGTLPVERFRYYIEQDFVFLHEYSRVLALAVAKGIELASMARFASASPDFGVVPKISEGFEGFTISETSPESAGTHSPPIKFWDSSCDSIMDRYLLRR